MPGTGWETGSDGHTTCPHGASREMDHSMCNYNVMRGVGLRHMQTWGK